MREIPFIGSLSTTPTWIGPSFHLDFRVILHTIISTLRSKGGGTSVMVYKMASGECSKNRKM